MNQETDDTNEAGMEDTDGLTVDSDDETESLLVQLLSPNMRDLIQKVRKVVFIFKNSPTKNDDYLQKYVREERGSELSLLIDSKTR